MPLPTPNLDDLRFQRDLVDEARRRIIRYCPEWTEYNVSDPGVTLIELFSWMTEMITYRLNRVPEKNYVKFLEMMGFQLKPASSGRVRLTFYLSAALPLTPEDTTVVTVSRGTEVATQPAEGEQEAIFTTDAHLVLTRPRLVQVRQATEFNRNYLSRLGVETFYPFNRVQPELGDTFYLGFDPAHDMRGYILRLAFECEETEAVGILAEDPPLIWECSMGDGVWHEVRPSTRSGEKDTTGGLNYAFGSLVLYLPLEIRPEQVHGVNAYWLRCRVEPRRREQGMYSESPQIRTINAYCLGGLAWATHAQVVRNEFLGFSDGEPGQVLHLKNAPVLACNEEEAVEVEEKRGDELVFVPWQPVADFSTSGRFDRHFTLDEATGEIAFGPSIRQPDGSVRQYGRIPEAGRRIQMSQYRHGGGSSGNVPPGKIQALRSAIPYVDRVINLERAEGGRDQETLEETKMRARRELRAQQRAVTAEDFENLARGTSRSVARAKCLAPGDGTEQVLPGTVELLVVPAAADALLAGDLSRLRLEEPLQREVQAHLDRFRLLTTTLRIREPNYVGVSICAEIAVAEFSRPDEVSRRVQMALRDYLSPLALRQGELENGGLSADGAPWEGWPFGRDLYISEVYSLIQRVRGVKHVLDVTMAYRPVLPSREEPGGSDGKEGLTRLEGKVLKVPPDTLLCSLAHQVDVADL